MTKPLLRLLAVFHILALALGAPALAQQKGARELPFLLKADEISFDRTRGIIVAKGNVEISHGERVLLADTASYDHKTDTATATGNVSLLEPTGEVIFAEYAEFTSDLKDVFVKSIRMLLADGSRFAANGGKRIGGVITEMRKVVYSPCELCKKDPTRAPIWQIKAVRVIHDQTTKDVKYRDATLEFFGVPVLYLPFFSHPDPTVKRRTGFLTPVYGNSSDLGVIVQAPFYIDIAPDKDATLTPIYTSKEGPVIAAEYRQRLVDGRFEFSGSFTEANRQDRTGPGATREEKVRGHIRGQGRFDLDESWRAGFDVDRSSDDTYLRRYGFGGPQQALTTRGFVEGFWGRDYATLSTLAFQGLREIEDRDQAPFGEVDFVAPFAQYNYVGRPDRWGGRFSLDASILSLYRDDGADTKDKGTPFETTAQTDGTDSRRISLKTGWRRPYTTAIGDVYTLSATLQTDLYSVDDLVDPDPNVPAGTTLSGVTGRVFPQLMLDWRYPLVRQDRKVTQLIEPVAAIVVSPEGSNPVKIPNEDSQDLKFDDTNLFSANRFTGVDRVESGQRVAYGLKWGLYGVDGATATAFLGQSYRLQEESEFAGGPGLEDNLSDIVGKLRLTPSSLLDFLYRFRFDADELNANRIEVGLVAGPPKLRLSLDYFFLNQEPDAGTEEFGDREEVSGRLEVGLGRYWRASANARQDLKGFGLLSAGLGVTYEDECFILTAALERSRTRDRDLEPKTTVFFRIALKHLGDVGS